MTDDTGGTSNIERISAIWKFFASTAIGVILGAVPLLLMTASKVDAGQVREIVATESPYAQDKSLIFYKLDQVVEIVKEAQAQIKKLQDTVDQIAFNPGVGAGP